MVRTRFQPDTEEMTAQKAEEMAQEQYERPFDCLTSHQQMEVWTAAEVDVAERLMGAAERALDDRWLITARCHRCGWEGTMEQLKPVNKPNVREPGDVIPVPGCPACGSDEVETE